MEVDFYRGYLSRYCVPLQVEQQGTQLETLQKRNVLLQEENNILKEKIHNLERCRHSQNYTCMQFFADRRKLTSFQTANTDFCVFFCCRRLEDAKAENKGLSQALSSKEASVQYVQQQLEEKTRECSVLSRQLQQTLEDAQKQV